MGAAIVVVVLEPGAVVDVEEDGVVVDVVETGVVVLVEVVVGCVVVVGCCWNSALPVALALSVCVWARIRFCASVAATLSL